MTDDVGDESDGKISFLRSPRRYGKNGNNKEGIQKENLHIIL